MLQIFKRLLFLVLIFFPITSFCMGIRYVHFFNNANQDMKITVHNRWARDDKPFILKAGKQADEYVGSLLPWSTINSLTLEIVTGPFAGLKASLQIGTTVYHGMYGKVGNFYLQIKNGLPTANSGRGVVDIEITKVVHSPEDIEKAKKILEEQASKNN